MEARWLSIQFKDISGWGLGVGGKTRRGKGVITAMTLGGYDNGCEAHELKGTVGVAPATNQLPARFE